MYAVCVLYELSCPEPLHMHTLQISTRNFMNVKKSYISSIFFPLILVPSLFDWGKRVLQPSETNYDFQVNRLGIVKICNNNNKEIFWKEKNANNTQIATANSECKKEKNV